MLIKKNKLDANGNVKLRFIQVLCELSSKAILEPSIIEGPRQQLENKKGDYNIFSKMDLVSSFHQILLDKDSRKYTAFTLQTGERYEMKRAPQGFKNSTSFLANAFATIFEGVQDLLDLLIYVDDLLAIAKDEKTALQNLIIIIQKMHDAGVTLDPEKCEFFCRELTWAGVILSKNFTQVSEDQVEKIKNWSAPKSTNELQKFLGLANFSRNYIVNYSDYIAPLVKSLNTDFCTKTKRKLGPLSWGEPQQKAFLGIIEAIKKQPRLYRVKFGDTNRPLILMTDSSDWCLSGVLMQNDEDGNLRLIDAISRLLTPPERSSLTILQKKCRALCFCAGKGPQN